MVETVETWVGGVWICPAIQQCCEAPKTANEVIAVIIECFIIGSMPLRKNWETVSGVGAPMFRLNSEGWMGLIALTRGKVPRAVAGQEGSGQCVNIGWRSTQELLWERLLQ